MDVEPRLLFSLGRHSKQAGDLCDLQPIMSPFFHPLHLSFPILFMTSYPYKVRHALSLAKKPSPGLTRQTQEELERVSLGVHSAREVHPDPF